MYRAKLIFSIMLFCFSAHLGSTETSTPIKEEPLCLRLISSYDNEENYMVARENYEEALRQSFDERWLEADEASIRAGWLDHGASDWALDFKKWLK